ncbi:MAG: hypothetical protein M1835_004316 [Candelina submexicana]|nr:MAG: hypothetical protein M1835_004316 [Candelina submexicana]
MPSDLPTTRKSSHTEMRDLGRDGNDESPESSSSTGESFSKGWKLSLIIFSLCLGALLVALDNTIIAVAVPQIATTFKALDEVGWYGSGYLLTVTALQPTFGKIYKYFNVKLVYLISIILFEGKSKALAGIGAAGVFQGGLCVIGLSVPLKKRPLYIAIVVSTFGLATCFGPILGGVLTSKASWRWCFWM